MFPNPNGDAYTSDQNINIDNYISDQTEILNKFIGFKGNQQIYTVQTLLNKMSYEQHTEVGTILKTMLQVDFIKDLSTRGCFQISEQILRYLDSHSLCAATLVSHSWRNIIIDGYLWKKLIEYKVTTDSLWYELGNRMGWIRNISIPNQHMYPNRPCNNISKCISDSSKNDLILPGFHMKAIDFLNDSNTDSFESGYELLNPDYYRKLYPEIINNIQALEKHWLKGEYNLKKIDCQNEHNKGVYCVQFDENKIVGGLRDNSIRVWNTKSLECEQILIGNHGSVLCLQYDDKVIINGSSDSMVRVWSLESWSCVNTISHHTDSVLHIKFANRILVTCSKDESIAVWDMFTPTDIRLRRILLGHRAAVNVVDFDEKYIVSAGGDRSIKVWDTKTGNFILEMRGHKRGIACLQYLNNLVVTGSSDKTVRIWQIESGLCLRTLEGHDELVRCLRFDSKYIISGAYDGKIKVWDLVAALNPQSPSNILCLQTLNQHTGRVFRLQFDEFQIVSSSHDDNILIWDFLSAGSSQSKRFRQWK